MSLSASVGTQIPTNVIEVGNEISQVAVDAIAASASPSNVNPMMTASAVSALGYIGEAPNNGNEYVRKNLGWAISTGGGGGLTIGSLSNAAASTLNATAPTNGQALTFDGTELKWATVGGGGGATWGSITGTLSTQTDLQTALDGKLSAKTVTTVSSGPYTIPLSVSNNILYLITGGMGFQVTIDDDSTTPYVNGTEITVVVDGLGCNLITTGLPTVNGTTSHTLSNSVTKLVKVSGNTWFAY